MRNLYDILKNRKTRILHSGYRYEGKLLRNNIDGQYLGNKHTNYVVRKLDLILASISDAIGNLELFFDIATKPITRPTTSAASNTKQISRSTYNINVSFTNLSSDECVGHISFFGPNNESGGFISLNNLKGPVSLHGMKYTIKLQFEGSFINNNVEIYERTGKNFEIVEWDMEGGGDIIIAQKIFDKVPDLKFVIVHS